MLGSRRPLSLVSVVGFSFFLVRYTRIFNIQRLITAMIELGLIDEAKETVEKWFARWISVVSYH
jgi:hypothetical protein